MARGARSQQAFTSTWQGRLSLKDMRSLKVVVWVRGVVFPCENRGNLLNIPKLIQERPDTGARRPDSRGVLKPPWERRSEPNFDQEPTREDVMSKVADAMDLL